MEDYNIIPIRGHYEAYDNNGKFICSGDTEAEVERELKMGNTERR